MKNRENGGCEYILQRVQGIVCYLEGAGLREIDLDSSFVLLAAALIGPDVSGIAHTLGFDEAFVETIARRMTVSGLWNAERVFTDDWGDGYFLDGFFEHLGVAQGFISAIPIADGFSYVQARESSILLM